MEAKHGRLSMDTHERNRNRGHPHIGKSKNHEHQQELELLMGVRDFPLLRAFSRADKAWTPTAHSPTVHSFPSLFLLGQQMGLHFEKG